MRPLRGACGALAWLLATALPAAADDTAERARIDAERRQVEARFAAEEHACRDRFEVTACVDGVKARRREALSGLREQELVLDDAERRRRAARRMQEIERKRIQAESRPPAPPQPAPVLRRAPAASSPAHSPRIRPDEQRAAAEAAQRAAAAEQRRQAAAQDRARIAEREARRKLNPKKSAPLPVPASATAR